LNRDMKDKILLDCDVLIHFQKGGKLSVLGDLFSEDLILLDIVKDEFYAINRQPALFDFFIERYHIDVIDFPTDDPLLLSEFTGLSKNFGRGESACMAFARFNKNIIASSNLKDIKSYCFRHSITIYTTMDILNLAEEKGLLAEQECDEFITTVRNKNSRLPVQSLSEYREMKK
jgi:predicted nucleic acid-binding protein